MKNSKSSNAYLYVLLGAMLSGTTGTAQAFAPDTADPLSIGAVRIAIGGISLLLISMVRGNLKLVKGWFNIRTLLAAVCMAAYQPLFFSAVSKTGVAIGTIVTIGSSPILAGLLSLAIRKEAPERKWYPATILAISGCIVLIIPGSGDNANWVGILLALGAGLSYALYALFNKELLEKYTPDLAIALIFSISAVLLAPLLFIYKPLWLAETSGLIAALHLGLIATALAYILFAGGLAHLPLPTAVTITLAEPLTATMLGLFLLDERLALTSFAGAALLFIGLLVLARK